MKIHVKHRQLDSGLDSDIAGDMRDYFWGLMYY
jgi:hypothetical protein